MQCDIRARLRRVAHAQQKLLKSIQSLELGAVGEQSRAESFAALREVRSFVSPAHCSVPAPALLHPLQCSVCLSLCIVCIVAKRCILAQKITIGNL